VQVPPLEKKLGIESYVTRSLGVGGRIKQLLDDFVVEELLVDGSLAQVSPPDATWEPVGEGHYLICVLVKRRWDTLLAVREVAKRLGISQKRIRFAGMKDTKALTAQYISLQGVSPGRVSKVKIKDMKVYPFRFSKDRMYSQLIQGHRFHIAIRAGEKRSRRGNRSGRGSQLFWASTLRHNQTQHPQSRQISGQGGRGKGGISVSCGTQRARAP
jgi:tRNA pseudouridine13 synthase